MTATALTAPRQLLGIDDLSAGDLDALLELAALMKRHPLDWRSALEGRTIACLFAQPGLRSRVSLEVAVNRLGALPVMLDDGHSIAETAHVLSTYCDAIAVSTDRHRDLVALADQASVPVINALSDREDPFQALTDCLALRERFGELAGLQVAYIGAAEPVTRSLIEAATLSGITLRVAAPPELLPDAALRASIRVCETPREAVSGAVAVLAGRARRELEDAYTLTPQLMAYAAPGAVVIDEIPANLLAVEQAVLRTLVTGDWEV